MHPVKTDHTNINLTKEGCKDLPGTTYSYEDGGTGIETCWELTPEDIKRLAEMDRPCIFVYTRGTTIPPILLTTECLLQFDDSTASEEPEQEDAGNENTEES